MYSEEINKRLIETQYEIAYDKKAGKKVRDRICSQKSKAFKILSYHKGNSNENDKNFFNESKLCLTDDIEKHNSKICCHRGCYYDAFLTNICSTRQYYITDDMKMFFDGYNELFPINKDKTIKSISDSNIDNQIGISTIGLTTDNYLVIWIQNGHNIGENGKASPSGSGSCDWADRKHGQTFNEIIEYAMQRELWEESGKTKVCNSVEQLGKTKLIGYYRWIEKGGKPEFLGVSRINFERKKLEANTDEVFDSGFDGLHFDNRKELIGIIEKLMKEGKYKEYKISLPLYMNLKCLYDYLSTNNAEEQKRDTFLFSEDN